jgi:hypothetical protein
MPSEESKYLMGLATIYPDKIKGAHWQLIRNVPCFKLIEVAALSVDLDPVFASLEFAMDKVESGTDNETKILLIQFIERYVLAKSNLDPFGTIPVVQRANDPRDSVIRLVDFAAWADGQGWSLPAEFPRSAPSIPPIPAQSTEADFVAWATAEREKHGLWPPTDAEKTGQRQGWRQWAVDNGVDRKTVAAWVKTHGFNNPKGHPRKSGK